MPAPSWLTPALVKAQAGDAYFKRGQEYQRGGHVQQLQERDGEVRATVIGTERYRVFLEAERKSLYGNCTCPLGDEGYFCKHCVAVALEWIERGAAHPSVKPAPAKRAVKRTGPTRKALEAVGAYLHRRDKPALVDLLIAEAQANPELFERLHAASQEVDERLSPESVRGALADAFNGFDEVDIDQSLDHLDDALALLSEMLDEGHAVEALDMVKDSLERLETLAPAFLYQDDVLPSLYGQLEDLHLDACRKARPNPDQLAAFLLQWQLRTDGEVFAEPAKYQALLGESGTATYAGLAEAAWDRLVAEDDPLDPSRDGRLAFLATTLFALAAARADFDLMVKLARSRLKNAQTGDEYELMAGLLVVANRPDEVLPTLEEGLRRFPGNQKLEKLLFDAYASAGRHDQVLAHRWREFESSRSLDAAKAVKPPAEALNQWPDYRSRILETFWEEVSDRRDEGAKNRPTDHSKLVSLLLWDGNREMAWQEAKQGGCSPELWQTLAEVCEKDYPRDAEEIYRQRIDALVRVNTAKSLDEAVRLLTRLRKLLTRQKRQPEYGPYEDQLRAQHKAKRMFLQRLDRM